MTMAIAICGVLACAWGELGALRTQSRDLSQSPCGREGMQAMPDGVTWPSGI